MAVATHLNIQSEIIPRLATGFCSGIARTGSVCGAVSGGIMAIGLALGRSTPSDDINKCYQAVLEFQGHFREQFGFISCLELTGVDLGTPEGQAEFREKEQIKQCTNYVGEATRMVLELVYGRQI